MTRREWFLGAALAPASTFIDFETYLPAGLNIATVTELDPSRLIAAVSSETGGASFVLSTDRGQHWGPAPLAAPDGSPHSLLRLNNGALGMIYSKKEIVKTASFTTPTRAWLFSSSSDNGRNWSRGVLIDLPARYEDQSAPELQNKGVFNTYPFGRLVQLSSGRLILPCYWYAGGRHLELHPGLRLREGPAYGAIHGQRINRIDGHLYEAAMGGCYAYYSDDSGKSWNRSTGSIMVWPLPGEDNVGGFGATWEPVVIPLKDARVLMFMRTNVGRIFQSFSKDGGDHWSPAQPTELASGDVPCSLGRLRKSGHLVVCWNQSSADEIRAGYSRGRLSTAISRDEAESWGNFKTVALSAGMKPMDRVALPPIRHVRANREVGELPEGYARYHYPRIAFAGEKVLLLYNGGKLQAGGEFENWKPVIRVVREEWLYS